tara:strand:+ start:1532 stop:1780 length:249 start_codon:yes stop_codon:yes gene_type:complete
MIYPINRFEEEQEPESDPRETKYHDCVGEIFDFIRSIAMSRKISMEECLGLLDVVKGSIQLNIALSKCHDSEEGDFDDYAGF